MKIAVIGTGYVGLVTGTCFAETGNQVICVDIDAKKVEKMKTGVIPIYEPGLEELFLRNSNEGRLKFTTSLEEGIKDAQIIFLALPTCKIIDLLLLKFLKFSAAIIASACLISMVCNSPCGCIPSAMHNAL